MVPSGNTKGEKYHCTTDLLFDWFGLVCLANKNKNCQLSYNRFQTSQTGGQSYSDTSPFSIPWARIKMVPSRNTNGRSITVPLTSCLSGED
jgi:hypothetical protein